MKKTVLGFVLVLALGLVMSSAMADPGARPPARVLSAADQAFLASLALPDPTPAAKRPSTKMIECYVTCGDGSAVACSGTPWCSATDPDCATGEPGHITCDGVITWCPNTCFDCATEEYNCSLNCNPCSYNFSCNATTQTSTCHCILRGCPQ
ncbi:MAG TPA: hypothetical protein VGM86_15415 [Thermoanaerobaculia bacterium]|jgi:hypothetical protein